ncbi:MAG: dipeptidase [Ornithinimicrobium sp.]
MIDGHNDLPWAIRRRSGCDLSQVDLAGSMPAFNTDIPRLRAGGVTGQFWSVYVPQSFSGATAVTAVLEQIDVVHRLVGLYPDVFALVRTAEDLDRAREQGLIASLLGMEGGHSIDGSLGVLRMVFALGVRYMTLSHNSNVEWVDSATDNPVLGGLSPFGEQVVAEMNSLGMLVDLSHVSAEVMRHTVRICSAPVIFSHSGARAITDVPRNVPDDVLESLRRNGGVCMVPFVPELISEACASTHQERTAGDGSAYDSPGITIPEAGIDDVVDHIEHIKEVAGVAHVGIGGDYDGGSPMPTDLPDVSAYPRVFTALRSRGWPESELELLASGNTLRVLREAEESAR